MNKLKAKLKRQGGFTLVEMLIVVAIIAILIAVSIPLVNGALEKARDATDQANERAAKAEVLLYFTGVTEDTLTINGTDYTAGSAIEDSDNVYYDAKDGKLVSGTVPAAYGQCTGGTGDKYNTGASHVCKVIQVTVNEQGVVEFDWDTDGT